MAFENSPSYLFTPYNFVKEALDVQEHQNNILEEYIPNSIKTESINENIGDYSQNLFYKNSYNNYEYPLRHIDVSNFALNKQVVNPLSSSGHQHQENPINFNNQYIPYYPAESLLTKEKSTYFDCYQPQPIQISFTFNEDSSSSNPQELSYVERQTSETKKEKPKYKCDHCGREFTRMNYLSQHIKNRHTDFKFLCMICGKKFPSQEILDIHTEKHSDKPFQCQFCIKRYNYKSDLNVHMFVHKKGKPYNCMACNKGFVRKDHFQKHQLTSTHEKRAALYNMRRNPSREM